MVELRDRANLQQDPFKTENYTSGSESDFEIPAQRKSKRVGMSAKDNEVQQQLDGGKDSSNLVQLALGKTDTMSEVVNASENSTKNSANDNGVPRLEGVAPPPAAAADAWYDACLPVEIVQVEAQIETHKGTSEIKSETNDSVRPKMAQLGHQNVVDTEVLYAAINGMKKEMFSFMEDTKECLKAVFVQKSKADIQEIKAAFKSNNNILKSCIEHAEGYHVAKAATVTQYSTAVKNDALKNSTNRSDTTIPTVTATPKPPQPRRQTSSEFQTNVHQQMPKR